MANTEKKWIELEHECYYYISLVVLFSCVCVRRSITFFHFSSMLSGYSLQLYTLILPSRYAARHIDHCSPLSIHIIWEVDHQFNIFYLTRESHEMLFFPNKFDRIFIIWIDIRPVFRCPFFRVRLSRKLTDSCMEPTFVDVVAIAGYKHFALILNQ